MDKKLYRSMNNKIIGGVCGGIGGYLKIDATIIRLVWLFLLIAAGHFRGAFVILYIAAWIIMPARPAGEEEPAYTGARDKGVAILIGGGFVIYGMIKIAEKIFDKFDLDLILFGVSMWTLFWPAVFIVIGLCVIFLSGRKSK
jgi:phage shock protein PspC (stress-responsive transcriptional regulator)